MTPFVEQQLLENNCLTVVYDKSFTVSLTPRESFGVVPLADVQLRSRLTVQHPPESAICWPYKLRWQSAWQALHLQCSLHNLCLALPKGYNGHICSTARQAQPSACIFLFVQLPLRHFA